MDVDHNIDRPAFDQVLQALTYATNKRDPRSIRLAAVTSALMQVIRDKDGTDCYSAAKVYAKTVTALEGTLTAVSSSKEEDGTGAAVTDSISTQIALLELLTTTVPYVSPPAIVTATLPLTSRILRAVVSFIQGIGSVEVMETADELGGVSALLRWVCRASNQVLGCVSSADEKTVKQFLLGTLLALFRDRRAKVRKAAQDGVVEVLLLAREGRGACHPVVVKTMSSYVHAELAKAAQGARDTDSFNNVLHLVPFVDRTIMRLNHVKLGADVMELLIALMRVNDASLSAASDFIATTKVREVAPKIMTISALLSVVTNMLEDDNAACKTFLDDFASRVLASLLQVKVSLVFRQGAAEFEVLERARIHFGETVLASCRRIVNSNQELACKLLPLAVQLLLLLSRPAEESPDDTAVADTLLVGLTQLFRTELPALMTANPPQVEKCLQDSLHSTEQVMLPAFKATWSVGLKCVAVLLQYAHTRIPVQETVEKLMQMRSEVPPVAQQLIEDAFSTLVQGVGIETCWQWIRFQSDSKQNGGISTDRSWILPALRTAAQSAQPVASQLTFFQSDVLVVARTCDKLAAMSPKQHQFHHSRVIDLWSLLPCFCKSPSDLSCALPTLTTTLSRALEDKRYPELVSIICRGLVVLTQETSSISDVDKNSMEAAATKLLPVLFKMVTESAASKISDPMKIDTQSESTEQNSRDGQQIRALTDAISSLARVAPKPFLHSLFQKLMHRLLEEIQTEGGDRDKICCLLSLSESLVASDVLEETNISFLYRALKPLLRTDEYGARVQKRAYKVLAEICQHHHSFVTSPERLKELAALLSGAIMTSQVAARYMRLKCLNLILAGFDDGDKEHLDEFSKVIGEVLLCLKDSNAKSRDAAYQFLLALASRDNLTNTLQMVTAGLGAETSHMRSAAVMALSRLVFERAWNDSNFHALLPSLLSTVLVLIDEDSREVIKSVVGFIRISVSAIPPEQLSPLLPELVSSLLTFHKKKNRFRAKIKIIMKKLVRQFGYETLMPLVPQSEIRLLTHMRKIEERQKRKKIAEIEAKQPDQGEFDELVDSDEEDSDDGRTLTSGMTGFSRLTGRAGEKSLAGKSGASRASTLKSVTSSKTSTSRFSKKIQLPNETDGNIVDMLGSKISKQVHFADNSEDDSDSDSVAMEFDHDGKLIIREEGADTKEDPVLNDISSLPGRNKKRRKISQDEQSKKSAKSNGLGAAYKSKKAGGDVKKKGQKYEPYAFMPLDGRSYSKKNRRAAVAQMSTVVRGQGKRKRTSKHS